MRAKIECNQEVLFFNKTPFFTKRTSDLMKYKDNEAIKESMRYSAETINNISKLNSNISVLIFGKSRLKDTFKPFIEKVEFNNSYIYCHPSYGNLSREWSRFKKSSQLGNPLEIFLELGKFNRNNRKELFKSSS
jgi:hypothetical protein